MSNSKRILYGTFLSPPVRSVRMTLEELKLDYDFKIVDVYGGELKTPEFLKKNPQHTVPTLEEPDGTCIWESHAIMAYLVRKYGKTDSLYPKDFYQRAVVDQRLHYDNGVLFLSTYMAAVIPILSGRSNESEVAEFFKKINDAYQLLETFLDNNQYLAGNHLTIADFSIVSTVSALFCLKQADSDKFPKLMAWFERMRKLPYYDSVNSKGISVLIERLEGKLPKTL